MEGRCVKKCPGHGRCTLSDEVVHTLCICGEPTCICHSMDRYYNNLPDLREWEWMEEPWDESFINNLMGAV